VGVFWHDGRQLIGLTRFCNTWLSPKQRSVFVTRVTTSDVVYGEMEAEEERRPLRVLLVTFNQGEWERANSSVSERVRLFLSRNVQGATNSCDVVVLATQEANQLLPDAFSAVLKPMCFQNVVARTLSQLTLGALQLHVWVRDSLVVSRVSVTMQDSMRCGLLSSKTIAKGAVLAQLTVQDSKNNTTRSLTFASLHLPSNASASALRNDCLARIVQRLLRKDDADQHMFLMGDLNYRTSATQTVVDARERQRIRDTKCFSSPTTTTTTKAPDQLDVALATDPVLVATGLREIAPRTFCPTCRFVETREPKRGRLLGPRVFDDRRHPSWCDRILYRRPPNLTTTTTTTTNINVERYDSWELTPESDHNAVFAIVTL